MALKRLCPKFRRGDGKNVYNFRVGAPGASVKGRGAACSPRSERRIELNPAAGRD